MTAGRIRRREVAWVIAVLLVLATAIVVIVFLATSTSDDTVSVTARRDAEAAAALPSQDAGLAASHSKPGRRSRDSVTKDEDANDPGGGAAPPGGVRIGQATSERAGDAPPAAPVAATTGTPTGSETATAKAKQDAAGSATSRAARIRTPQTFVVHVSEAESGRPVRAAAIDLRPREGEPIHALTDGEGRAPFTLPPDVAFDLEAKSRGRLRVRRDGVIAPTPDTVIDVALERGVVVKGNVRGPKGPIAAATVRAFELAPYLKAIPYDPDPRPVEETQTDRSGAYRLDCIPRGVACALVVEADPFAASCDEIDPQPDPDYVLRRDVALERGALVQGVVIDEKSRPVEGACVFLMDDDDLRESGPHLAWLSDAERTEVAVLEYLRGLRDVLALDRLRARTDREGRWRLLVPASWDKAREIALHPTAGRSPVSPAFEPGLGAPPLALRGRLQSEFEVWTPDGKPAKGVEITPYIPWETWTAPAIAPGRYGPASTDDGVLLIDVAGPAGAPGTYVGRRAAGDRIVWEVHLAAGATWKGIVRDDRKLPVRGALVTAGERSEMTNREGRFELHGVHPSETFVEAVAPGHARGGAGVDDRNSEEILIGLRRTATLRLQLRLPDAATAPTWRRVWVGRSEAKSNRWERAARGRDEFAWNDGVVELSGQDATSDLVVVFVPGYALGTRTAKLAPGESADLGTLDLQPARRVRGVVLDESNAPVTDAEVRVRIVSSPPWRDMLPERSVDTNTRGEFEIEVPAPGGECELVASAPGYFPTPMWLDLRPVVFPSLVLGKPKRFLGRVNSWNRTQSIVRLLGPHGEFYAETLVDEGGAFSTEVPLRPSKAQFFQEGKTSGKPTQEADVPADWRDSDLFRFP